MPYFTLRITAQGPMLTAFVGVSQARHGALTAAGRAIPDPIRAFGLVDTGASGTCIDPSVLTTLGLTPTGVALVSTPSSGNTPVKKDQYDISILVPGALPTNAPLFVENLPVVAAELLQIQGFHALIGRDILSRCLLNYDGVNGAYTLAY